MLYKCKLVTTLIPSETLSFALTKHNGYCGRRMKKEVSPGVVLTLSSRRPSVAQLRDRRGHPWTHTDFRLAAGPPWDLLETFRLADGHDYRYRYSGLGDFDLALEELARIDRIETPGTVAPLGGVLFNASTRPRCVEKVLL